MTNQQKRVVKILKRLIKKLNNSAGNVQVDKDANIVYVTVKKLCPARNENAVAERWLNASKCNVVMRSDNTELDLEMMIDLMEIECDRLIGEVV